MSSLITIIILAVIVVLVGILSRRATKLGDEKTRVYAEELGISVRKVSRSIPVSHNRGHSYKMKDEECFEYSIQHNDKSPTPWALLQRFDSEHESDNFWKFQYSHPPSQTLLSAVNEFKTAFDEEFFEVEVKNGVVSVYWEEWGGQKMVDKILNHMRQFASTNA